MSSLSRHPLRCVVLWIAALSLVAGAATAERERRPKPETRRVKATVSEKVYRHLTASHQALADGRYEDALQALERVRKISKLSAYEQSRLWQTYGYVYASQERYAKALDAFERCIATGGLPKAEDQQMLYNLAQLYIGNEQYQKGVETLERWFRTAESPTPEPYFLMANAHYQMDKLDVALEWAEKGLQRTDQPREGWLQLALGLYVEKGRYRKCAEILEQLLARFPKKQYWKQLAGIYGELGREKDQLSVFELAYRQGLLTRSSELVQMAQLFLYHALPHKAARVLEEGLRSGSIESTADNWELLANSLLEAREYERAEEPLRRAASLSADGDLYLRLAQLHLEGEAWEKALEAIRSALDKGGLKDPGQAHLLLGIANFNAGRLDESREAFTSAAKYERSRKSARQWLRHLEQQRALPANQG